MQMFSMKRACCITQHVNSCACDDDDDEGESDGYGGDEDDAGMQDNDAHGCWVRVSELRGRDDAIENKEENHVGMMVLIRMMMIMVIAARAQVMGSIVSVLRIIMMMMMADGLIGGRSDGKR